jgi:hypothetical protein
MGCMEMHRNVGSHLQLDAAYGLCVQPYGHAVMQPAAQTKRNRMSPLTSAAGHSLPMITTFLFMYNGAYLSSTMVSTLRN